jgi:hypothetical protein
MQNFGQLVFHDRLISFRNEKASCCTKVRLSKVVKVLVARPTVLVS